MAGLSYTQMYKAIAEVIRMSETAFGCKLLIARAFADKFGSYGNFNREQFLRDCSPVGTDFSKVGGE